VTRLGVLSLAGLAVLASLVALAASNSVPLTRVSTTSRTIDANALKPPECASLNLTAIALVDGGAANELVVGTAAGEGVSGGSGDDCILGGGGDDSLRGDGGTDVCNGGPGGDGLHPSCETKIQ
jgi:Ca2+-binding RTX toxin-like protein